MDLNVLGQSAQDTKQMAGCFETANILLSVAVIF